MRMGCWSPLGSVGVVPLALVLVPCRAATGSNEQVMVAAPQLSVIPGTILAPHTTPFDCLIGHGTKILPVRVEDVPRPRPPLTLD